MGGFDAEAAGTVTSRVKAPQHLDTPAQDITEPLVYAGLLSLTDTCLLIETINDDGHARFTMLETIREYAAGRLTASGEDKAARQQHATYYLSVAEPAAPELGGPDQTCWLARLEEEHENFRAALGWSLDGGDIESGLQLARRLTRPWHIRGYAGEGRTWLERLLSAAPSLAIKARAWPTYNAGLLAWAQGDLAASEKWFERSLVLFQAIDDKKGVATALGMQGAIAEHQGNYLRAARLNEASLSLYRELENAPGVATTLDALGGIAVHQGNYQDAAAWYEEGLALYRELEDMAGVARVLGNLGELALPPRDIDEADALNRESLALHWEVGYKEGATYALENLAGVAVAPRQPERAARLFGAAEAMREAIGTPLPPSELAGYERDVAAIREQLGDDIFSDTWAAGRSLQHDQVRAEVLGESGRTEIT